MVHFRSISFFILFVGMGFLAHGQTNRYMVFFSDKDNVPFSLERPQEFLSQKAINRRAKHNIPIVAEDLPVDSSYVTQIGEFGTTFFTSKWFNAALIQMNAANISTLEELTFVDKVEFVAPGEVLTTVVTQAPSNSEARTVDLDNFSSVSQAGMLGANEMHDEGYRGEGILIAILDGGFTGVDEYQPFQHLFTNNQIVATKDFVTNSLNPYRFSSHGTGVLSCMGSFSTESLKGLAYNADYALLVTEEVSTEYRIEEYNWVFGAEFADSIGADIINTSLGYTDFDDPSMDYNFSDLDGETTVISRAAEKAFSKGIFMVTSAGNLGNDDWRFISAPADSENILTVGAVDNGLERVGFSSIGPTSDNRIKPDVVALGQGVTVFLGGRYQLSNGTSFAAPLVAGLAAGLMQANPDWTNDELLRAIKLSGSNAENPNQFIGYGVPNFRLEGIDVILNVPNETYLEAVYPNPVNQLLNIDVSSLSYTGAVLFNQEGRKMDSFQSLPSLRWQIDFSGYPSGVYFLKLQGISSTETVRIVKQ